jgi:hypothetical protein
MPRNGPQPREGESERSVTTRLADTTENESATTAESARGIAQRAVFFGQRAVLFKTVFSALVFDSCRGVYNPPAKEPKDQAQNDQRSKMAYVHVRSARPSRPKCENENGG